MASFILLLTACFWPQGVAIEQSDGTPGPPVVIVEWSTESEVNEAGFNLYRSERPDGPYIRLNQDLIPASSDPLRGGTYTYTDTAVTAGSRYYYRLEDVELDGSSTMHEPVQLTPSDSSVDWQLRAAIIGLVGLSIALSGLALVTVTRRGRPA